MQDAELKKAFALALMEHGDEPYKVAFAMFPTDTAKAIEVASSWPKDADVIAHQTTIKDDPYTSGALLSKYQAAREILARARACRDDETYCKLMSLYCTVMSQIDRPGTNNTNNTVVINKVIMIPATIDKQAWSVNATQQQRQLTIEGERINGRQ